MANYKDALEKAIEYFNGDELAAQVFLGKYALTAPEGDILEPTPRQMHERLAREFARIEAKYPNPLSYDEILAYFDKWEIVPQGSPMAGIGNPFQTMSISNCFVAGTKVHTSKGVKNIEDIAIGDEVVTHMGRVRTVSQVHKNKLNNRKLYNLKCYRTPNVVVTENHKFFSISKEQLKRKQSPGWNSAEYLRAGDYIQIPNNKELGKVIDFNISSLFGETFEYGDKKYLVDRTPEKIRLVTVGKNGAKYPHDHFVPSIIHANEEFAYFLGLWYGDGCVFGENTKLNSASRRNKTPKKCVSVRGITFTFGSHENNLSLFVQTYLKSLGIPFDLNKNDHIDGTTQIVVHSPILGYAFEKLFGRRFDGKKLNDSIHSWTKNMVEALLRGIVDSDGTITQAGDVRVVLSNKNLVKELYHLFRSRNILVGYSETASTARLDFGRNDRLRTESRKSYADDRTTAVLSNKTNHCIEIDGNTYVEILDKSIADVSPEYVYTFGVEEDHSYAVEGIIAMNCFVIESPYDSYSGILKTDQEEAQIMKRRGGVGFDISTIRPKGIATSNAAKTTDGIGVFMERFSNTCREVAQGGRRGALMLSISVHHPEIQTFINIKRDLKKVTGANISIRLTDEFMNAVKNNTDVELRWPVDSKEPSIRTTVSANEIWNQIIDSAWASAEPGLLFWDTVDRETPTHCYPAFKSTSTNPCGEIVLSPFDSCRLLLVNVSKFINNPFGENAEFDVPRFQKACYVAQKLMDDIVDIELECIDKILNKIHSDPEPEHVKKIELDLWNNIRAACVNGRRTGLGVTAVGDSVAMLNCIYGSNESIEIVETFYRELALNAYRATVNMAKDRGPFPVYDYSLEKEHPFINRIMNLDPELRMNWEKYGRRNIGLTTTAPAGSVSVLTQTTSGIEPAFLVSYKRRKKINPNDKQSRVDFVDELGDKWQEYTVYHHQFKNWMNVTGKTDVKDSPYFGAMSNDIDWVQKVKVQAAAQKWICHAISNTTNLPADTTKETVKNVYMTGWESGCKGVTIYRDGCRSGVLVSDEPKKEESKKDSGNQRRRSADKVQERHAPKRPKELPCEVHAMTVGGEKWTFFVGTLEGKPYEIIGGLSKFVSIPKRVKHGKLVKHNGPENPVARYDFHFDFEKGPDEETIIKDVTNCFENATYGAFTRTISLALRHGTPVQYVVEQLTKGSEKEDDLFSFSKAATRVLKQYIADGTKVSGDKKCKECGSNGLVFQEGCLLCTQCGSSKCG